ncbi:MAG: hypothetical protein E7352_06465 [Clostridiales bacterium]|nr:hypothetical protein [Clostridiales bacterium]
MNEYFDEIITQVDEYFCEKYANYDKLCLLPGYKMPLMQASEIREDGRTYAYTLPPETMSLSRQEKKTEILAVLKERMVDVSFSFSFRPMSIFRRFKNLFSKYAVHKTLNKILEKYKATDEEVLQSVDVAPAIWKGIRKNKYLPSKNLIFTLALTQRFSFEDTQALLNLCGYQFEYIYVKDVIMSYLLKEKVFNPDMLTLIFQEYKVTNLFLR